MSTDFIKKEELSIGNLVDYNGRIGRVVWIQKQNIGWRQNEKGEIIQVPIKKLKPVMITRARLNSYLNTIQYLKNNNDGTYTYDEELRTKHRSLLNYRIQPKNEGVIFWIRDPDCPEVIKTKSTIKQQNAQIVLPSIYYKKMHCFQNLLTNIINDLTVL